MKAKSTTKPTNQFAAKACKLLDENTEGFADVIWANRHRLTTNRDKINFTIWCLTTLEATGKIDYKTAWQLYRVVGV